MSYTGILKHYSVRVDYRDGSVYRTTFTSQGSVVRFLDSVNLTETEGVLVCPVWSKKGETVKLEVKHQS
jgi:hypothetical protein